MERLSTGSDILDKLLSGGYEKEVVTTIYGPAGSGKTTLCLLCAISTAEKKKVIYIDTEGGFSVDRIKQITPNYQRVINNIVFLKPTNFEEQKKAFGNLGNAVNDKVGVIIFDTIAMLYRLELGKDENSIHEVNRELGKQIAALTEIARKKNIPTLMTNQVYMDFQDKEKVNIVGGDIIKYGSKCLMELQIINGNRKVILRKHRNIAEEKSVAFKIVEKGIEIVKEGKGFKLFQK